MEGYSVTDERVSALSQERRNALAKGMLELFFLELYEWGCLQTDPNFGNYLLNLQDRRKKLAHDELVLLDFGSILDCSRRLPLSPAPYHLRRYEPRIKSSWLNTSSGWAACPPMPAKRGGSCLPTSVCACWSPCSAP